MKKLLFLLLFPAYAMAQYPGNANQKITLGEQTTADGLVYRGVAADTTLTVKSDTAAYFVLDTVNLNLYTYKASASGRKWRQLGADTAAIAYVNTYGTQTVNGAKTFTSAVTATRFNPTANTATGTGMFLPATNTLGFSTNGTKQLEIASTGAATFSSSVTANTGYYLKHSNGNTIVAIEQFSGTQGAGISLFNSSGTQNVLFNAGDISFIRGGNVGIGQTTATAALHLKAGTSSANTAPLKFTSGTNLTTAEAGAMEFNGTNLFFSPSTTRHTVNHGLTGSATIDFADTSANSYSDQTITVTGASDGDVVSLGIPNAAMSANNITYTAWVSASNTVTIRFANHTTGSVNPASGTFKVFVTK